MFKFVARSNLTESWKSKNEPIEYKVPEQVFIENLMHTPKQNFERSVTEHTVIPSYKPGVVPVKFYRLIASISL